MAHGNKSPTQTPRHAGRGNAIPKHSGTTAKPLKGTSRLRVLAIIAAVIVLITGLLAPILPEAFHSLDLFGSAKLVRTLWEQSHGNPAITTANLTNVPEDEGCIALVHWLPEITYLPGTKGYANQWRAHWAEQAQTALPSCVTKPRNATEVSQVVTVLKNLYDLPFLARARGTGGVVDNNVRFVVRSGGHSVEFGHSSINGGVLIDLAALNFVVPADDRKTVLMGPGARWGEVFTELEKIGLITAGGRNGRVGVGGLATGGGLSWLSPQVGMVHDNIFEYEVVLANGSIVVATEHQYADLWRALKGGSGNFGIVTAFKARTFPATKVWGGYVYYFATKSITEKLISAVHAFADPEAFDKYAAWPILAFGSLRTMGIDVKASVTHVLHTKPEAWPTVWNGLKSIFYIWSQARIQSYASAAEDLVGMAPYGKQQYQATLTIKNDLDTMQGLHALFDRSWEKVKFVKGISWNLVFQPLTPTIIHQSSSSPLGLDTRNATDPLIIVLVCPSWTDTSADSLMYNTTRELVVAMEIHALLRGTLDRYLYLNYAAGWQNVFASYGEENHDFLRSVSKKYDEYGFWQNARAGGFKLGLDRPGSEAYPQFEQSSAWDPPVHTPPAHVHESEDDRAHHAHGHDHHHH